MKPKVKICGITNINDALNAVLFGADALGFVFYKGSSRYISSFKAKSIISALPPWTLKIGLFVNEKLPIVKKISKQCNFDFIQLHGDEDSRYIEKLKNYRLIKAVRIKTRDSINNVDKINCELILFDTFSQNAYGGTGRRFDWSLSKAIRKIRKPYIISGGLTASNVSKAVKSFRPYAVDVSSAVEKSPGEKSAKLVKEFIKNAKQ